MPIVGNLSFTRPTGKVGVGEYVIVQNVDEAARKIVQEQSSRRRDNRVGTVWTIEHFKQEFLNPLKDGEREPFSEKDIQVLLKYLDRDLGEISALGNVYPPLYGPWNLIG